MNNFSKNIHISFLVFLVWASRCGLVVKAMTHNKEVFGSTTTDRGDYFPFTIHLDQRSNHTEINACAGIQ
jgi:hypothetical protein